jgi:uncharacterized membrane protein YhaH (DUF805 family)
MSLPNIPRNDQEIEPFQLFLKDACIWVESKFGGRIGRRPFLCRFLLLRGVAFVFELYFVSLLLYLLPNISLSGTFGLAFIFVEIPALIAIGMQTTKRLHDIGRSGDCFWLLLIPVYDLYLMALIFFEKGDDSENVYGVPPSAGRRG